MTAANQYFSLVFQLLQECPFKCEICHRRNIEGERRMSREQRREMVQVLKRLGLKRMTVTGGEPTILKKELFEFLEYLNSQKVHTCLSTTGHWLTQSDVKDMDRYLDQILLSVRSLELEDWISDFGETKYTEELYETVLNLLGWLKSTGIIVEVSSVIHKENIEDVIPLGRGLLGLNPDIIWRVDEYYPMGLEVHRRNRFDLTREEFDNLERLVKKEFEGKFRQLVFSKAHTRVKAPDYFITPSGDLVTTSDFSYSEPTGNVLNGIMPTTFTTRRPWQDYERACRDWGWKDFSN